MTIFRDSESFILNKHPCTVYLKDESIHIRSHQSGEQIRSCTPENILSDKIIPLSEIISVKCVKFEGGKKKPAILVRNQAVAHVAILAIKRHKNHRWSMITVKLRSENESLCERWSEKILENMKIHFQCRPKSLLVFVNPWGGRQIAETVYNKKVKHVFEAAAVKTEVIITRYQGHARSYIEEKNLTGYDGLISVGGDGMLNEVANGLICKTQEQNEINVDAKDGNPRESPKFVRPDLRVGVIPAGSTDCVSYVTNGISDPLTAALHIVLGDSHPIDVTSLHNSEGKFKQFSLSLTGYGFYGDMLKQSEHFRWMGPPRYTCVGVNTFIQNRSYSGEIRYLPTSGAEGPNSSSFCRSPCLICQNGFNDSHSDLFTPVTPSTTTSDLSQIEMEFDSLQVDKTVRSWDESSGIGTSPSSKSTSSCSSGISFQAHSTSTPDRPNTLDLKRTSKGSRSDDESIDVYKESDDEWKVIKGEFIVVNSVSMSCACDRSPYGLSPASHLSDGALDLITVKSCSRFDFLRYLISHTGSGNRFDFPFVEARRVKAFQFVATSKTTQDVVSKSDSELLATSPTESACSESVQISIKDMKVKYSRSKKRSKEGESEERAAEEEKLSCWNSDGEIVKDVNLTVRAHRGLLLMFCRGIEQNPV